MQIYLLYSKLFCNFAGSNIQFVIMYTFLIALVVLIEGYALYGLFVEQVFGIDPHASTPATTKTDGIDYVPMKPWRIFLIQFLNIAGLGPIFGAIMGIFYGPTAFLWIVFGCIFAGAVHDYLSGMMSIRLGGVTVPEVIGEELGEGMRIAMRVLSVILLLLLTTTFIKGPAELLQHLLPLPRMGIHHVPILWVGFIFIYYILATLMPINKLIGRFYPVFGAMLLFMGVGIMVVMLTQHGAEMPELTDGLQNRHTNGLPLFPMMFVSIACGAISGFHSTQSPLMSRCMTSERQGRTIFYGAMIAEGVLALVWAAAAGTFFADPEKGLYGIDGLQAFAAAHPEENIAALVVDKISKSWLGIIGGILAVIGVIAAPITSGDTALRSARLIVSDFMHLEQKSVNHRLWISLPLFALVGGLVFIDFEIVWRYFSWVNQTLALFALWAGTVFLYKQGCTGISPRWGFFIAMIPAMFMTMVSVSYIIIAPEGFHIAETYRWIAYAFSGLVTIGCIIGFSYFAKQYKKRIS